MRFNDFVARVAELNPERSHQDAAHGATQAVLEALAPHLDRRQVASLTEKLPPDLGAALEGSGSRDPEPDLPARVVERVGVDEDEAAGYVRAVGTTLRDVLGPEEYERTMQALPEALRSQIS